MNRSLLFCAFLSFFVATFPASVLAKAKVWDQIVSVDKKADSITLAEGPKNVTYKSGSRTKIYINGKEGTFAGLKPKMKATVEHKEGSMDADMINAETLVGAKRRHSRRR